MRPLLLALLATLLLAAPASAAKFVHNGPDVEYSVAATDTTNLTVTGHKLGDPRQQTYTPGAGQTRLSIGAGCSVFITTGIASCGIGADASLRLTTNDNADVIDGSGTAAPFDASSHEVFDTKGGDDVLKAGPLDDEVQAGDGDDTIVGGAGADALHGDAGNDSLTGLDSGDVIDGGAGDDSLDLSGLLSGVSISLDGEANDGPLGADANVIAIETVRGTPSDDLMSGSGAPDRFESGDGDDRVDVRGGGADVVDCGPGADDVATVDATDQVTGCETVELPAGGPAGGGAPGPGAAPAGAPSVGTPAAGTAGAAAAGVLAGANRPSGRLKRVRGRLTFEFLAFPNGVTTVTALVVRGLSPGGRAELRCHGRCGFRRKVGRARGGTVNLRRLVRGRLRTGAVLEVRLTAPGTIGRVTRFKMRKGRPPVRTSLCLTAGGKVGRCAV
jgi:hypothetical protein